MSYPEFTTYEISLVSKSTMFKLDTNKSFDHMWHIWRLAGIFPPKKYKLVYNIYGIIVNLVAGFISPISTFINVFFIFDMELIIKTLQVSIYFFTLTIKHIMIYIRLSKLGKIKTYLRQLDERASVNKEEFKYLKKTIKQCQYISRTIQIIFIISFLPYSLSQFIKKKPFIEGWLNIENSSKSFYLFYFGLQFFPIFFQILQNTASDAFSPVGINLLNGQIRVLCMRVARIGNDNNKKSLEENYEELKCCINDHRNIIDLFNIIEPTVGQAVLLQLIITGVVLCLTVFQYLKFSDGSLSEQIGTVMDMIAILIVSFPVCYFGNSLIAETERLTSAIYNCNWIDQNMKFQKTLIIFMQQSQKKNILLAGGLISINLETFIAIIRFSFSMFTVVSQLSVGIVSEN